MTPLTFWPRYWWARLTGQTNRARGLLAGLTRRQNREAKELVASTLTSKTAPPELSVLTSEPK